MIVEREGTAFEAAPHPHWAAAAWERQTYHWLGKLLDRPAVEFVDVGAWIGPFTLWAAKRVSRVLAIEPDPEARRLLLANVARNDATNIDVTSVGLGNVRERRKLYRVGEEFGRSTATMYERADPGVSVEVEVQPLYAAVEAWTSDPARVVVKMDTEGAEAPLLRGSLGWLRGHRPSLVIAPHQRLYHHDDLIPVMRELEAIYRHTATAPSGAFNRWAHGDPPGAEPALVMFSDWYDGR